jgi:hypothetical protein
MDLRKVKDKQKYDPHDVGDIQFHHFYLAWLSLIVGIVLTLHVELGLSELSQSDVMIYALAYVLVYKLFTVVSIKDEYRENPYRGFHAKSEFKHPLLYYVDVAVIFSGGMGMGCLIPMAFI